MGLEKEKKSADFLKGMSERSVLPFVRFCGFLQMPPFGHYRQVQQAKCDDYNDNDQRHNQLQSWSQI